MIKVIFKAFMNMDAKSAPQNHVYGSFWVAQRHKKTKEEVGIVLIKSMTGYGRNQALIDGYDITIEIRAVNHRYFEFYARLPRNYGHIEDKLKTLLSKYVARGKVELSVSITPVDTSETMVNINLPLATSYAEKLGALAKQLNLENDLTITTLARFGDIFAVEKSEEDEDKIWGLVQQVAEPALENFVAMRTSEGVKMEEDVLSRLELLEGYMEEIKVLSPVFVAAWRQRLEDKIRLVLEDNQLEEGRIITEAAIFAEKTAVDEETVRLASHLAQFRTILNSSEAVGRKLDFLTQEINREINTIGSKFQDVQASILVVEMKSETEKVREQIQNIE